MAPDRGDDGAGRGRLGTGEGHAPDGDTPSSQQRAQESDMSQEERDDNRLPNSSLLTKAKPELDVEGRSFTLRGVAAGLLVGLIICFSNMYFGLQTGWVSMMTMPASLMGFGIFKTLSRHLQFPFSPVENVLVQTVAGSMAIMPLGCGFVGVLPAMNYLLKDEEQGPINLSTWQLVIWSLGLCYFGVVFAVPLRRQVIIREKLKFPSGFSTAVLISVLHGKTGLVRDDSTPSQRQEAHVVPRGFGGRVEPRENTDVAAEEEGSDLRKEQWRANVKLLLICFLTSGLYTFVTYFFPMLRDLPIFGTTAASTWLWTLNPSLAYVGQGIVMGPVTTLHMVSWLTPGQTDCTLYADLHAVAGRRSWLGCSVALGEVSRLGSREDQRLGERQQRLDSMDFVSYYARGCRRQSRLPSNSTSTAAHGQSRAQFPPKMANW